MAASIRKGIRVWVLALGCLFVATGAMAAPAKNMILMIGDGMGMGNVVANYHATGKKAPYEKFEVKMFLSHWDVSTYNHWAGKAGLTPWNPEGGNDSTLGYDPAAMWADFAYHKSKATDSASSITAFMTGVKTVDGNINYATDDLTPLKTLAEYAAESGKSTGAVSSVPFSHATPAGVAAHNPSRNNYAAIAKEMIFESGLDVIMGTGHPLFDPNGQPMTTPVYNYLGQPEFEALTSPEGANGFRYIETKADFEKLAKGSMKHGMKHGKKEKIFGLAQNVSTLQQSRSNDKPEFNDNVPDLATMSKGALNVLGKNKEGFFVMIEGGAIDWANHGNQKLRTLQETQDFNKAVKAVIEWVEKHSSWEETLLVVTADHECGALWGPDLGVFNLPEADADNDDLPEMGFNSGSHSNALVGFYAKGAGANFFRQPKYADGVDHDMACLFAPYDDEYSARYIDNTDVFHVGMKALGLRRFAR